MQTGTQILTGFLLALAFQPAFAISTMGSARSTSLSWCLSALIVDRRARSGRAAPRALPAAREARGGRVRPRGADHRARDRVGAARRGRRVRLRRGRRAGAAAIVAVVALALVILTLWVVAPARDPCAPHEWSSPLSAAGSHTIAIAVAQFAPAADTAANLTVIGELAATASDRGAAVVVFPEYSSYFVDPFDDDARRARAGPRRSVRRGAHSSSRPTHGVVHRRGPRRAGRRWPARAQHGRRGRCARECVARYRKLHLYDAFGQRESDWVEPGDARPSPRRSSSTACGSVCMTCYDLRFPEVGRLLADAGADVFLVPAEWVRGPLKEHHWRTLRARARDREHGLRRRGRPPAAARGRATR